MGSADMAQTVRDPAPAGSGAITSSSGMLHLRDDEPFLLRVLVDVEHGGQVRDQCAFPTVRSNRLPLNARVMDAPADNSTRTVESSPHWRRRLILKSPWLWVGM